MKIVKFLLGVALSLGAVDALAQDRSGPASQIGEGKQVGPAAAEPVVDERMHAALTAYGQWLVRLNEASAIANSELTTISAKWRQANSGKSFAAAGAQFRPVIAQAKLRIAEAREKVLRLDTPEFAELELTEDARPATLVRQTIELLAQTDRLLDEFLPLLKAGASGDMRAIEAAGRRMLETGELLLQSQAIMAEASASTEEKDSALYYVLMFQARTLKATARVARGAGAGMGRKLDPTLSRDLEALAGELVSIARKGRAAVDAELIKYEAMLESDDRIDANARVLFGKLTAVFKLYVPMFDQAAPFAAKLRALGAASRNSPPPMDKFTETTRAYAVLRDIFIRVATEESRIIAGS